MYEEEIEIASRINAGDRSALREIMKLHGGAMIAAARGVCPHAVDDVVQEAWIAALAALPNFEHRSSLKTWLVRITINKAYTYVRQTRREVSLDGLSDAQDPLQHSFDASDHWVSPWQGWTDDSPDKLLEAHVLKECLEKHLDKLPQGQRMAMTLTDFMGLDAEEVCNNLAVSASNLRVLLHRARITIHAMVAHYEATGDC
ncbi:MAG: sigma-70 family RNA polymerase sigma factor [Gammaproteobacteria bacterium]|nr:sigma-70 family RNA polymerase sigma factor [Gammaproteobacteria bacterium]